MQRRTFFTTLAAAASAACGAWWLRRPPTTPPWQVSMRGADSALGHRVRTRDFPAPTQRIRVRTLIVGAGIAGMSAARTLRKSGQQDFLILDLEGHPGGNSAHAHNHLTAYPLGAHYLPIPNIHDHQLMELLAELGVIRHFNAQGIPLYDPYALCFAPQERLFINGHWQSGLLPEYGVPADDLAEIRHFLDFTDALTDEKGSDGRYAFDIPARNSSRDAEYMAWRTITFADWLDQAGYRSPYLLWYLDYCCRDDYGMNARQVCAWAGLHYFASRKGIGQNAPRGSVLTWPEGNGYLATRLAEPVRQQLRCRQLAYDVREQHDHLEVSVFDANTQTSVLYHCEEAILAVPQYVAARMLQSFDYQPLACQYAPWLVANIELDSLPNGTGQPLSWDNVIYNSAGLGYIHAQHQHVGRPAAATHITYYKPYDVDDPAAARRLIHQTSPDGLARQVLDDLKKGHFDVEMRVRRIECHVWGHGMVAPTVAFYQQPQVVSPSRRIRFAHSDLSGISIFEEAFHAGLGAV
jgi:NAD(P)-binding Rossmann-like domain